MEQITYRRLTNYKYQLREAYDVDTGISTGADVRTVDDWVVLDTAGRITLKNGYAWDGPSGPTIDTKNFMRPSLVHDGFYQLMRDGKLDPAKHRLPADKLLRKMCLQDGMSAFRAGYVYRFVRMFGERSTRPRTVPENETAPR